MLFVADGNEASELLSEGPVWMFLLDGHSAGMRNVLYVHREIGLCQDWEG
jgi:hypothetical protein